MKFNYLILVLALLLWYQKMLSLR